jgi:hypothetical protein
MRDVSRTHFVGVAMILWLDCCMELLADQVRSRCLRGRSQPKDLVGAAILVGGDPNIVYREMVK